MGHLFHQLHKLKNKLPNPCLRPLFFGTAEASGDLCGDGGTGYTNFLVSDYWLLSGKRCVDQGRCATLYGQVQNLPLVFCISAVL